MWGKSSHLLSRGETIQDSGLLFVLLLALDNGRFNYSINQWPTS